MRETFWQRIPHPIIALSPMDGVTDSAYRLMAAMHGKPDVLFTEFTSVEGISAGAAVLLNDLLFSEQERPIAAQFFGADPESFYRAAFIACELGFDGIDINMGCPARNVAHHGGGAALIQKPELAQKIIQQAKQGVTDWTNGKKLNDIDLPEKITSIVRASSYSKNNVRAPIPVSIKTRIGYSSNTIIEWVKYLLEEEPTAISIHGRTLKQMYAGKADWEAIGSAAMIIHQTQTIVLGNGDVSDLGDANTKITQYGVDGVLIGRASMGNPWIFRAHTPSPREKLSAALEHADHYRRFFPNRPFIHMRKNFGWYIRGFDGAKELRMKLLTTDSYEESRRIIQKNAEILNPLPSFSLSQ